MSTRSAEAVVIGGGPAGMMAAITAAARGRRVLLVEHERFCGKKLRITGKGRCNVCNNCDVKTFLQNIPGNPKFLYSALNRFGPADTMAYFESLGVPLKTERGQRVFPVSDNAHDIARALERELKRLGVELLCAEATAIRTEQGTVAGVETSAGPVRCESALIATGGLSYPLTGSTGDGYPMAAAQGHSITALRPSLVPLECEEPCCGEMQGFSLKNVRLRAFDGAGQLIYNELGELLFTHFGVSGPLVLSASAHMRNLGGETYRLEIDLKPGLDAQQLDARLLRDFEKYKNRDFANALCDLAGRSMIPVLVERSGIPPEAKVHSITRAQRQDLLQLLKAFPLTVRGARPIAEAIVTAGGVSVQEVDPRSMQSKLLPGLYFAGEILDVDGYTGGFNLQIAWSTGYVAGNHI